MKTPTLEDIFYSMNIENITSPDLEDEERALRRFLEIVTEKKKFKKSYAKQIGETAKAICQTAKCAGFAQGFVFALRLLCFPD